MFRNVFLVSDQWHNVKLFFCLTPVRSTSWNDLTPPVIMPGSDLIGRSSSLLRGIGDSSFTPVNPMKNFMVLPISNRCVRSSQDFFKLLIPNKFLGVSRARCLRMAAFFRAPPPDSCIKAQRAGSTRQNVGSVNLFPLSLRELPGGFAALSPSEKSPSPASSHRRPPGRVSVPSGC